MAIDACWANKDSGQRKEGWREERMDFDWWTTSKHWHGTLGKQGIAFTFTFEMLVVGI